MWLCASKEPRNRQSSNRGTQARSHRFPSLSAAILWALVLAVGTSGCSPRVKVEAPDKPIEINVNVKIEQEVRIKLDEAVESTLAKNPELFGMETRP